MNAEQKESPFTQIFRDEIEALAEVGQMVTYVEEVPAENSIQVLLECGRKQLKIIFEKNAPIKTHVENLLTPGLDRVEHETTILYFLAKRIMTVYATLLQKDVPYLFQSRVPNMHSWAEKNGRKLFMWGKIHSPAQGYDELVDRFDIDDFRTYRAVIHPEKIVPEEGQG